MADKVPWTTFDAFTLPYHNEKIPGFILRYGLQNRQWGALSRT